MERIREGGRQGNLDVDGGRKEAEFMGLKRGRKQGRGRVVTEGKSVGTGNVSISN